MNSVGKWIELKKQIRSLTELLHETEADIWLTASGAGQVNPNGSKTSEIDGYKVTITHSNTYKIDQRLAEKSPDLFRVEYKFDKKAYDSYPADIKNVINEALTIVPAKPSFKIEEITGE